MPRLTGYIDENGVLVATGLIRTEGDEEAEKRARELIQVAKEQREWQREHQLWYDRDEYRPMIKAMFEYAKVGCYILVTIAALKIILFR